MGKEDGDSEPVGVVPVPCIQLLQLERRNKVEDEPRQANDHIDQELIPDTIAILDPPQFPAQGRASNREKSEHECIDREELIFIKAWKLDALVTYKSTLPSSFLNVVFYHWAISTQIVDRCDLYG